MNLLRPSAHHTFIHKLVGPALLASTVLVFVGAGMALGTSHAPPAADPCALPAGVRLADLEHRDAALVTRRLLACGDLRFGRIDRDQYLSQITALDRQWTAPTDGRPALVWASTVRGFSSQYSPDAWSARQVLGAPDVYPRHGDEPGAWASVAPDAGDEWLEVGFDHEGSVRAIEVYETFNPGAVDRVELIGASGRIIEVRPQRRDATGRTRIELACTAESIVAARVHVASARVTGWNEIDAIGVVPCDAPAR
jgi:hypothetical protein